MRPLVARTSEELMDLLAARGMCQPDKPLPPKIRVEGEPMLFPLDLSHIPSEYRFNERGPLAFVDARNIDFGRATLVSDWSHALFAQSNLSDATLAGSFYRLFMDGVFLNPRQFDRLSAHR